MQLDSRVKQSTIKQKHELGVMFGLTLPDELAEWWSTVESAEIFVDVTYGQSGLVTLSPSDSLISTKELQSDRPRHYREGDIVFGKFMGDSDLLIVRCSVHKEDFSKLLVALPIYPRSEWYKLDGGLTNFFVNLLKAQGKKYWEGKQPLLT